MGGVENAIQQKRPGLNRVACNQTESGGRLPRGGLLLILDVTWYTPDVPTEDLSVFVPTH
jgi:hypothetical protein